MNQPWIRLGLVAALGCAPCLAQQSALEPPDLHRYVRWGPLRARPGFQISNFGYDNNIFATGADQKRVGDYTITLGPRLDGLVLFGDRAFLTFRQQLAYTAYRDYSDLNYTDLRFSSRTTFPLRGFGVFVEGSYNRLNERPVDEEDVLAERDEDGLGVGVILVPGWRTELEIARARKEWSYYDPDADPNEPVTIGDRLDRTEDRHTLEVRYRIFGRTRLTLNAHVATLDFDSPIASGRDSDEWGLLPGIDFGEGGSVSGSLRLGWTVISPDSPLQANFDDVVGRAELAFRPGTRTRVRLEAWRKPGFTVSSSSVFYLDTQARLRTVYYLTRIIGIETGGGRGTLEFPNQLGALDRKDRIGTYEAGLRFRLSRDSMGRRVEYSLRYRHYRRTSSDFRQNRTGNVLGLDAIVGF
jgi:hypothetical protein